MWQYIRRRNGLGSRQSRLILHPHPNAHANCLATADAIPEKGRSNEHLRSRYCVSHTITVIPFALRQCLIKCTRNVGINVGRIAQPLTTNFEDFTYSTPGAAILVTAELMTGLLVSCIPTLAPLLKRNQTDAQRRACFPTHLFTSAAPSSVFYKLFPGARSRSTDNYAESVPDTHTKEGSAAHTEMSEDYSRDPSVYQGHDRQAAYSKAKAMPRIDSSPVEIEDGIEMRVDVDTYQSESRRQSHQPILQTSG